MTTAPRFEAIWTRANLSEVFPEVPSPYSMATMLPPMNEATRLYYGRLLEAEDELGPVYATFNGRPYLNLSQFARIAGFVRISPEALTRSVGHGGEDLFAHAKPVTPTFGRILSALPTLLRLALKRVMLPLLLRRYFAVLRRDARYFVRKDPAEMDDERLWAAVQAWNDRCGRQLERNLALVGLITSEVLQPLELICRWVGFPRHRLLDPHMALAPWTVSGQAAFDLVSLALTARDEERARTYLSGRRSGFDDYRASLQGTSFLLAFDEYLSRYGHRGPYETDLSIPRHREDPAPLLAAIANHVTAESCPTPEEIDARERIEAAKAWNDFSRAMRWWQRPLLSRLTRYLLRKGKRAYVLRELSRSELVRVTAEIRRWLLVLAQRFVSRGWIDGPADFFFLLPEEIAAARGAELRRYITRRKSEHDSWRALHMPMLIRGVPETDHIREEQLPASAPAELHGQCISAGVTEGDVVVVRTPMEYERMKPGSILVAPATDSAWMPLFTQAVGIIVETGGVLSHAAVVAREFGLPALANVKDATGVLRDGMTVRLDATNEVATILRASEPDG